MHKRKFFRKLLLAYVVIVCCYTSVAAGVVIYKNNASVKAELALNQKTFLEQAKEKMDKSFLIALNLVNQLKALEPVLQYAAGAEPYYYNVLQVYNRLKEHVNAFSDFGYRIDISQGADDLVVTSVRSIDRSLYYDKMGFSTRDVERINRYLSDGKNYRGLFITREVTELGMHAPGGLITMVKKERLRNNREVVFFISFYEEFLLPELSPKLEAREGFGIMNDGRMLTFKSGFDAETAGRVLDEAGALNASAAIGYRSQPVEHLVVHRLQSDIFRNLTYVYVTEPISFAKTMRQLIVESAKVYGWMAILFIGIAFVLVLDIYRPVRSMMNVFTAFGEAGEKDEFSFVKETALRMNTSLETLQEAIQNQRQPLKIKFMRDLLYGLADRERIRQQAETFDLACLRGGLAVAVLEFTNVRELEDRYPKEAVSAMLSGTIDRICRHIGKVTACECFGLEYDRYAMLLGGTDERAIGQWLVEAVPAEQTDADVRVLVFVGQPVPDVHKIEESFHSALGLLEHRFSARGKTVVTASDLPNYKEMGYFYPIELERDLISYVIQGKGSNVHSILRKVLEENLAQRQLGAQTLSQFLIAIAATVNRILQQTNKTPADVFPDDEPLYMKLKKVEDIAEIRVHIEMTFAALVEKMNVKPEKAELLAERMTAYIHQNYTRDISLNEIADTFQLSPSYVSLQFKQMMGENFKEYLNRYRVKQVKQLMIEHPGMKVGDMAEKVGITNTNTLIRIFKKYEGISPGVYAERIQSS